MNPIDIDIHSIKNEDFKKYELIDIREEDEIENLPPLVFCRHVPFSQFPLNTNELDKSTSYLLFCAKGGRSHFMAEALNKKGYQTLSINNGIASVNAYLKNMNT